MSERQAKPAPADVPGADKKVMFRRRKSCPFTGPNAPAIDWKDPKMLLKFMTERGKMMPSRITIVSQKKQRLLSNAIKRARFMALVPYVRVDTDTAPRSRMNSDTRGY